MFNLDVWFCCLNVAERNILLVVAAAFATTMGMRMECEPFEALWIPVTKSRAGRRQAFIDTFGLYDFDEYDPITETTTCWITTTKWDFWLEFQAFLLTPAAACPDGCDRWTPS